MTVTNGDITVTKYMISEITNAHDFVEAKKGNKTINLLETNSFGFADIIIVKDTIIIQYLPNIFYRKADRAFDYIVKLDTSISVEYWQQKVNEREKGGKE